MITRRVFQLSLKSVFLIVLVISAFFAGQASMRSTLLEQSRQILVAKEQRAIAIKRYEQSLRGELLSVMLAYAKDKDVKKRDEALRLRDLKDQEEMRKFFDDINREWEELEITAPIEFHPRK